MKVSGKLYFMSKNAVKIQPGEGYAMKHEQILPERESLHMKHQGSSAKIGAASVDVENRTARENHLKRRMTVVDLL